MKALAFSGGKDSMACLHLLRDSLDCAIYVETGFSYPETRKLVEYAGEIVPMHIVYSDRNSQNAFFGSPAEIVPIDWTLEGQLVTTPKATRLQSYLECCYQNIARPLLMKAKEAGVTELFYGQRRAESHRGLAKDGDSVFGLVRRHPIEDWSEADVMSYLATKMEIPAHYSIKHSSLDCYDCTAYCAESKDRLEWTRTHHPVFFAAYKTRASAVSTALKEALVSVGKETACTL